MYIPLRLTCRFSVLRFRPARISQPTASDLCTIFSLNGYDPRLYVQTASSSVSVIVSSASYRLSPLNSYGLLTSSYSKVPSVQSLHLLRMYCTAFFAVTVLAPLCPARSAVVTSPNSLMSSRILITCSSSVVLVSVFVWSPRLFTRQT